VTVMRTLRHPIAMFMITVLIAIGIGVSVVAVTQTSKVYGPSWGQFTASFSGKVYVQPSAYQAGHTTSVIYANQPWSGWVAYSTRHHGPAWFARRDRYERLAPRNPGRCSPP
jgi:hypothetical protein